MKNKKITKKLSISEIHCILKQQEKKKTIEKKKASKKKIAKKPVEIKKKPKEKIKHVDYGSKLRKEYGRMLAYGAKALDYSKLFDHMGKEYKDPYKEFVSNVLGYENKESSELAGEKLEKIIKAEQMSLMLKTETTRISVEERESYKHWKEFNKMWNMMKIQMSAVGEAVPGVFYF